MPYDRERVWQLEAQLRKARQKLRMRKAKQMAANPRLKLSKLAWGGAETRLLTMGARVVPSDGSSKRFTRARRALPAFLRKRKAPAGGSRQLGFAPVG
jgi:hypothetical protein